MRDLCIGLISGTSMDGIDAVLAEFGDRTAAIRDAVSLRYPPPLQARLRKAIENPHAIGLDEFGALHAAVGDAFAEAADSLLEKAGIGPDTVLAIGSHGQTLRHRPDAELPFTLQIGDPARIAVGTGITTVADFRSNDMALGGQGAPLVPPFHAWLWERPDEVTVVLNLGGIANITILPGNDGEVTGFDTGPGNTLLDAWSREKQSRPYDAGGEWAAGGSVHESLLDRLMSDPYIAAPAPKSTGFEYFNMPWIVRHLPRDIPDRDVQSTLAEFSAWSIADAIRRHAPTTGTVICCGGGTHNPDLLRRLGARLPEARIASSASIGLDPDWVEATAFAWLASRRLANQPGNLPAVTGASRPSRLGAIYPA